MVFFQEYIKENFGPIKFIAKIKGEEIKYGYSNLPNGRLYDMNGEY